MSRALPPVIVFLLSACSQQFVLPETAYQTPRLASRGVASELSAELRKEIAIAATQTPILVGPAITSASGEITKSGRDLQTFLLLDLKALMPDRTFERLGGDIPIESAGVISAFIAYQRPDPKTPDDAWFRVDLVLNDKDGKKHASAAFRINARQFDPTPSRFFLQSPIFYATPVNNGSENAANTGATIHLAQRRAYEARSDRGVVAYEAGQYADSKKIFQEVLSKDADNLLALSGVYQNAIALGQKKESELALDRLIDAGIKQGNLSFKFLFRVRSAAFRDDFEIAEYYPQWISRVAVRLSQTKLCLRIEGHASRSGSAEVNQALSKKRAQRVAQLLTQQAPQLNSRIQSTGFGFAKNIVGSGTDDATDAIDRRVEFVLHPCQAAG